MLIKPAQVKNQQSERNFFFNFSTVFICIPECVFSCLVLIFLPTGHQRLLRTAKLFVVLYRVKCEESVRKGHNERPPPFCSFNIPPPHEFSLKFHTNLILQVGYKSSLKRRSRPHLEIELLIKAGIVSFVWWNVLNQLYILIGNLDSYKCSLEFLYVILSVILQMEK